MSGAAQPPAAPVSQGVDVEYVGGQAVRVRGQATGQLYEFSSRRRVRRVHPGDAVGLLRSASFRRASSAA